MAVLLVVDKPDQWSFEIPAVEVVAAWDYLTDRRFSELRRANVYNLCRSYRYQSAGYYVSLLAAARGHRPFPDITTIQDMKSQTILRFVSDDLDELIQKSLAPIQSQEFVLSIYFGRNLARRYDRLSLQLFNLFQAPLLRASFTRTKRWQLANIKPVGASEIPESHKPALAGFAKEYFSGRQQGRRRKQYRFDLAILHNPQEEAPPSDERALKRFCKAAQDLGMRAWMITRDDYARLAEFDALFIRETTFVNHYTYRFAQRAVAEGLPVVDNPDSIVRCSNKVYQAELFGRHKIPAPKTDIVHKDNVDAVLAELSLPCVLKRPDSSFSQGVVKVVDPESYHRAAAQFLEKSEFFIAQEFLPTPFDWRVGVWEGHCLYVCKYHMAQNHWQIINWQRTRSRYGRVEAIPVDEAPRQVVRLGVKAAGLIGNNLYGVDVKQVDGRCYVMEVNENPNIDSGLEDQVLGQDLYLRIMAGFLRRIERRAEVRPVS